MVKNYSPTPRDRVEAAVRTLLEAPNLVPNDLFLDLKKAVEKEHDIRLALRPEYFEMLNNKKD